MASVLLMRRQSWKKWGAEPTIQQDHTPPSPRPKKIFSTGSTFGYTQVHSAALKSRPKTECLENLESEQTLTQTHTHTLTGGAKMRNSMHISYVCRQKSHKQECIC